MAIISEPIDALRAPSAPLASAQHCVILAEHDRGTRRSIAAILAEHEPGSKLIQVDTLEAVAELGIDKRTIVILVCNVDHPREMATLRRLRREVRGPAIVAVSPAATGTGVRRALDAGADAIVFDSQLEETLAVTVRAVGSGQSVVPRELRASVERPAFSHRERQVLSYVAQGLTNAQIADRLYLSESTIKSHLSSAFSKFGVRSRREAAALFIELEKNNGAGLAEETDEGDAALSEGELR
jgi:DNA-binding NarL/FixJ family response regulator